MRSLRGRHNGETTKSIETTGAGLPRHMKNKMAAVLMSAYDIDEIGQRK